MKKYQNPKILRYLYWNKNLSLKQIAKILGTSYSTLYYWMIKHKIQRRKPKKIIIPKTTLLNLYINKNLNTREIANKFRCSDETIRKKLVKYGIPRKSNSESKTKYPKKDFSKNKVEKAYMLGIRIGDLYVRRNHAMIRIKTSTTHKELLTTLKKVFGKYGHFITYKYLNKGLWEWRIECDLNKSFKFLLNKFEKIPNWILNNNKNFYSFLAGYSDADGSWIITSNGKKGVRFIFSISSNDKIILEDLKNKLKELGYHPRFDIDKEKGTKLSYGKCNKDVYILQLLRKNEVKKLAKILLKFSQHREKILKMKLILSGIEEWSKMSVELKKFKDSINKTVLNK
jgi:transposase